MSRKSFLSLLIIASSFFVKAETDSLTIGRTFNWQVGDTFMYRSYEWMRVMVAPGGWQNIYNYREPYGFTVNSRINSTDSIMYTVMYFDGNEVSLQFTHLDSTLYSTRSAFPMQYNCFDYFPNCMNAINCAVNTYRDSTFS